MAIPPSSELQQMIDALKPIRERASLLAEALRQERPFQYHNDAVYHDFCKTSTSIMQAEDRLKDVLDRALSIEGRERGN